MVRAIIIPESQHISIDIPSQFIGKRVEVIAFSIDEPEAAIDNDPILTHLASEKQLAKDWLNVEEDKAWQNL
jgi:hypothetical protein